MPTKMSYSVTVEVAEQVPDLKDGGTLVEKISKKTIELLKLQRTNAQHGILATTLFGLDQGNIEDTFDAAMQFVKVCCLQPKDAEMLLKDRLACFSLFTAKEVQEDINGFFGRWELTRELMKQAEEVPEI